MHPAKHGSPVAAAHATSHSLAALGLLGLAVPLRSIAVRGRMRKNALRPLVGSGIHKAQHSRHARASLLPA